MHAGLILLGGGLGRSERAGLSVADVALRDVAVSATRLDLPFIREELAGHLTGGAAAGLAGGD